MSGYWLWKLINIFYYCDYVTIFHLVPLYHDWSTEKQENSISPKLGSNRKTCNHFLKSSCISELSWNFLKNTNSQVWHFPQSARYVSNKQSCLKTTGLMMIFYLVCFTWSVSYSVLPFHLVYVLNFSISLFFVFDVLSQAFTKCNKEAFLYTHKHTHTYCCSVTQSCPNLCGPMDCSMPGFPVLQHLLELAQTHIHWVHNAIQPYCPLLSPSPPIFSLSQHQGLFQWASSSHQMAKVLELQLLHLSFQWIFRIDFL